MPAEIGPVSITYVADLRDALSSFKTFGASLKEVGAKARETFAEISESIGLFENLGTAIGGAVALHSYASFDQAITRIRATLRQTSEEFAESRAKILQLSDSFNIDSTVAADGYNKIAKAGYDAAASQEILTAALKGSKATTTSVADVAGVLTQVLKTYSLNASNSADVTGKLVAASERGAFNLGELSSSLGTLAPFAAKAGIGLDELLATLTSLSREQGNLGEVSTQLRSVLSSIVRPSDDLNKTFLEYTHNTVGAIIRTQGFAGALKVLSDIAAKDPLKVEQIFPNQREAAALLKLFGDNAKSLNADLVRLKDSGARSLDEAVKTASEGLEDMIGDLERLPKILATEVFEKHRDVVAGLIESVHGFAESNHGLLISLVGIGSAASAASVGLLGIKFATFALKETYDEAKHLFELFREGRSAIVDFAANSGGLVRSLKDQAVALSELVPLRVRDQGVLDAWQAGLAQAAAAQNVLDAANLRAVETAQTLAAAEAELAAVSATANAARVAEIAAAEAKVAALREEAAAASLAAGVSETASAASVAADAALIDAETALAALRTRLAAATEAEAVAEAQAAAAKTAHAAATEAVVVAEGAQAAATAASATATTAATAASFTFGGVLKSLFPTFAAMAGSISAAPAFLSRLVTSLSSVAGVTALLRGGFAGLVTGIGSLVSGLTTLVTGVLGVLLAKLLLIAAVAYGAYKLGREVRSLISDPSKAEEANFSQRASESEQGRQRTVAARDARDAEAKSNADALVAKYKELAEEAKKAAAGDLEAVERMKALHKEIDDLNAGKPFETLKTSVGQYGRAIADSIEAAKKLGVEGAAAITVQRDKYGNVISITGDYEKVLGSLGKRLGENKEEAAGYGDQVVKSAADADKLSKKYKEQQEELARLTEAQREAVEATTGAESAQAKLNQAVETSKSVVNAYRATLKSVTDGQVKSGLNDEGRAVFDLADEYAKLTDIVVNLTIKRKELQAAIANKGGSDPASEKALADINAQLTQATTARRENERQVDEAIVRERTNAAHRVAEAEIAALTARGKIDEAERRKADLALAESSAKAEAALAADLRGRDAILAKAAEQLKADRERASTIADPGDRKAALNEATAEYEHRVKLARQLEAEAVARYPREKQAAQDLYDSELEDIERNRRKRFEATDEGRRLVADVDKARQRVDALREAEETRSALLEAQKRGDLREEASLREQLIGKLREAGEVQRANLEKEQQSRLAVRDRIGLLRDELDTRFRLSGLKGDFASAARSAQSDLAGSSDAAGFRAGVRSKFGQDATEGSIEDRRQAIIEALKREEQALAIARSQIARTDADAAAKNAEIAEKQKEVLEKLRILNQEAERAKAEARSNKPVDTTEERAAAARERLNQVGPGDKNESFTKSTSAPSAQPAAPAQKLSAPGYDPNLTTSRPTVYTPGPKAPPGGLPPASDAPGSPAAPTSTPAQTPAPARPAAAPKKTGGLKQRRPAGYIESGRYNVKWFDGTTREMVVFTNPENGATRTIPADDLENPAPASDQSPGQKSEPGPAPGKSPARPSGDTSGNDPGAGSPIGDNLNRIGDKARDLAETGKRLEQSVDKFAAVVVEGFRATDASLTAIAKRLDDTAETAKKSYKSIEATGQQQQNAAMGG